MDRLNFSIEDHESIKIVNLVGNITNISKHQFIEIINQLSQKNSVILNMKEVNLITSSGLEALVDVCMAARQKNKRVLIMGLKENLFKIIDAMDQYEFFIFIENIDEGKLKLKYYL